MAEIGYCKIDNLKLKQKSINAVKQVKEIMSSGNILATALAATPFYNIFGTPSVVKTQYSMMISIREHDWETFASTLSAVPDITKNRINFVATQMAIETSGKESKFWGCVINASS